MTDERAGAVPVKDLAVLIPLFATSLAISWEVGRFQPLGGFLFFSLSEHLLNAMRALPVALGACAYFAILLVFPVAASTQRSMRRVAAQSTARLIATFAVVIAVGGAGGWYTLKYFKFEPSYREAFLFGAAALMSAVILGNRANQRPLGNPVVLSFLGGALIILAMMLGIFQSDGLLNNIKRGSSVERIATISSKNDASKGYVLMAGERGLLIYFPDGDRISFQKADEVQKIEWQR